jgi:hypothetical protein
MPSWLAASERSAASAQAIANALWPSIRWARPRPTWQDPLASPADSARRNDSHARSGSSVSSNSSPRRTNAAAVAVPSAIGAGCCAGRDTSATHSDRPVRTGRNERSMRWRRSTVRWRGRSLAIASP